MPSRSTRPAAPLRRRAGASPAAETARAARVLAPTDFSEAGNYALAFAYRFAADGGTVYLLHALEEAELPNPLYAHYTPGRRPTPAERAAQKRTLEKALRALVPADAARRGIATEVQVVAHREPGDLIAREAERLGVDLICMGASGRSALARVVTGSVALRVAAKSRRPLVLVRKPRRR